MDAKGQNVRQSFQAPTRFAGQFQTFDPLVGDCKSTCKPRKGLKSANRVGD